VFLDFTTWYQLVKDFFNKTFMLMLNWKGSVKPEFGTRQTFGQRRTKINHPLMGDPEFDEDGQHNTEKYVYDLDGITQWAFWYNKSILNL
jgi:hypothetical protein